MSLIKSVKKAGSKAAKAARNAGRSVGNAMPGYGEVATTKSRKPKTNRAGRAVRGYTGGGKKVLSKD